MNKQSSRASIAATVGIAHAIGLFVCGVAATIGTTAGFSIGGGGLGLYLGGIVSFPWLVLIGVFIWFQADWIYRHPVVFAVAGPVFVCGTYAMLADAFIETVAVSTVTSSICYLALTLGLSWRRRSLMNTHGVQPPC